MIRKGHWIQIAAGICLILAVAAHSVGAAANSISVTLTLDGLPGILTLCRDSNAIKTYGIDEEWGAFIDVDNNKATGLYGFDVVLTIDTLPQNYPCNATAANTQQSLVAGVAVWDASQSTFVPASQTATVVADLAAHTLTITTDVSGVLSNLNTASTITVQSVATYTPSGTTAPTSTDDVTNAIEPGTSTTDPVHDAAGCSAPCSTAVAWYPLIDVVGLSVSTTSALPSPPSSAPPPPYGPNTLDVEFDLDSLPTTVTLCSSPTFENNPGYDIMWMVGADFDFQLGAYLTLIAVHTPLQEQGCGSPTLASTAASLQATVFQLDPNNFQNGYIAAEELPFVSADADNNRILLQLNGTDANFSSISVSPLAEITVEGVASSPQGDFQSTQLATSLFGGYPRDQGPQFAFGSDFVDAASDVCTASGCTSASYPVIDLIGGAAHRDDYLFRNGFE